MGGHMSWESESEQMDVFLIRTRFSSMLNPKPYTEGRQLHTIPTMTSLQSLPDKPRNHIPPLKAVHDLGQEPGLFLRNFCGVLDASCRDDNV